MTSFPVFGSGIASLSGLPVRFPPPYSVQWYISQEDERQDPRLFIALQIRPGRLSISHDHHSRDTLANAQRKRWKHWGGQGASEFRAVSVEIDIPFVRCVEEVSNQRWLAT